VTPRLAAVRAASRRAAGGTAGSRSARPPLRYRLLWPLAWPLRQYLRHSPLPIGKGFLIRNGLLPLLPPPPHTFVATLPGGGRLRVQHRELIGYATLLERGFEVAETRAICAFARAGSTVVDAGANIGSLTVPLAKAVGPRGRVLAFEPLPANAERLRENVALNGLRNVEVGELALGEQDGTIALRLADDPALHSTVAVFQRRATGEALLVPVTTLDRRWREAGAPDVSALKIDVEGAELAVLKGSEQLLRACRPTLLVEAAETSQLEAVARWLAAVGYVWRQPAGFKPWNYLFEWRRAA